MTRFVLTHYRPRYGALPLVVATYDSDAATEQEAVAEALVTLPLLEGDVVGVRRGG